MTDTLKESIKNSFGNTKGPLDFVNYIMSDTSVSEADKALFDNMWQTVNKYEEWDTMSPKIAPDIATRKLSVDFNLDGTTAYYISSNAMTAKYFTNYSLRS